MFNNCFGRRYSTLDFCQFSMSNREKTFIRVILPPAYRLTNITFTSNLHQMTVRRSSFIFVTDCFFSLSNQDRNSTLSEDGRALIVELPGTLEKTLFAISIVILAIDLLDGYKPALGALGSDYQRESACVSDIYESTTTAFFGSSKRHSRNNDCSSLMLDLILITKPTASHSTTFRPEVSYFSFFQKFPSFLDVYFCNGYTLVDEALVQHFNDGKKFESGFMFYHAIQLGCANEMVLSLQALHCIPYSQSSWVAWLSIRYFLYALLRFVFFLFTSPAHPSNNIVV